MCLLRAVLCATIGAFVGERNLDITSKTCKKQSVTYGRHHMQDD